MTTIVSVRRGDKVALGGDGQVTLGTIVIKASARKVRRLHNGKVIAGFAGGTADAFTLFERFESKLEKHPGNLMRAAVELAKDWRIITGNGDVLEPEDGLLSIGSGGPYAQAAARALLDNTDLDPEAIITKALNIAGDICIYSNQHHTIETL